MDNQKPNYFLNKEYNNCWNIVYPNNKIYIIDDMYLEKIVNFHKNLASRINN